MKSLHVIQSLERRWYFSPLVFSPPSSFAAGANPSGVIAVDLTGNGTSDVVTSNFGAASISVLRGNNNGTFQPPVLYPVGSSPEAIATADFNADGKPDIVTANEGDQTISVLFGNGDGTFAPQMIYSVGLRPEAIAVADLNGDGQADIVVANEGSNTVSVLLNHGDGTFAAAMNVAVGDQPDGLAVADLNGDIRPDIVAINSLNSVLRVALNRGDGTFNPGVSYPTGQTARAVAIADLNSDGRPDVITTSLHDTRIDVLQGNGDGTLQNPQSYMTGFFPFALAIADINGDGRLDVVTANELDNTVGVLLHTGTGTFVKNAGFHGGQAPVGVAVADFNGDGRLDIVAADFNTATVSVLMNQTHIIPLIPTTITLSPNQNPVQVHNRVVLTATVAATSLASRRPLGVVQFFDGDRVIGVAHISANGSARIAPTSLSLGSHNITAHYAGDGIYAAVTSSVLIQAVVGASQTAPFVQPGILSVQLAKSYVPGDRGVANVAITDIGDGAAIGTVGVQLYASTSTTFDASAFPISILSNPQARLRLVGGRTLIDAVKFAMPTNIQPVNYTIFAALSAVSGLAVNQVSTSPAVGLNSAVAVLQFGIVPTRSNYTLTRTLAGGNSVSLSIDGPGTGNIVEDPSGGISVALSRTNGHSTFTIASSGVTLDSLSDDAPVGQVVATNTTLAGAMSLNGSVARLTLGGVTQSSIFLGGGVANVLSLGTVSGLSLYSAAPIRSLAVNSWSNTPVDGIITAYIGALTSDGNFGPSLTINGGSGPKRLGISTARIGGSVGNATWSINANVGALQLGGVAAGWSGSFRGTLISLTDTGDFDGSLAAHNIQRIRISGSLTTAVILAGADFGTDARQGSADDTYGKGILTSLVINGSVTNSIVAAGLAPAALVLLAPGTTLQRASAIKAITISGAVDTATKFLAVSLPATASIDGGTVSTTTDSNFHL